MICFCLRCRVLVFISRLKERFPHWFQDLCLYCEVVDILGLYKFKIHIRRFIQGLFANVNFDPVSYRIMMIKCLYTTGNKRVLSFQVLSFLVSFDCDQPFVLLHMGIPVTLLSWSQQPSWIIHKFWNAYIFYCMQHHSSCFARTLAY